MSKNASAQVSQNSSKSNDYVDKRGKLAKLYYLYEVSTAVYMLEPWEKAIVIEIYPPKPSILFLMFRINRYYSANSQALSSVLKKNLVGFNADQIFEEISSKFPELKKYMAAQIYNWIYHKGASSFDQMLNISLKYREDLKKHYTISFGSTKKMQTSIDGTKKLLLEYIDDKNTSSKSIATKKLEPSSPNNTLPQNIEHPSNLNQNSSAALLADIKKTTDVKPNLSLKDFLNKNNSSHLVEAVYIPEEDRGTLCVSSQVGCALNCKFCHTGTQQFMKNLAPSEIVGQYLKVAYYLADFNIKSTEKRKISNIVFMGQGEPLLNYRNLKNSIALLTDPNGIAFSRSKITVSTSGIVPLIEKVATDLNVQLAISLHAANDSLRSQIMPINKTYPIKPLINAAKMFSKKSSSKNKRVTFE
ncbi:hypothetical protein BB561_005104 [Smittium simulii]|uniref:Radical SAM core domain-containing protein n=1 Tax=Smittium simulii TaxID=133385 RepID=A0A2T9YCA0_9FUNG|nr:hypothetical protein BB561_005104 [Smittium simulii]